MVVVNRVKVERHGLFMRVAHWLVLVEGIILTLTGFQLGGILGISLFPSNNMAIHVMTGLIFIVTATLAVYDMIITGDYFWVSLRRIPYSFKYVLLETKAWFNRVPTPKEPVYYEVKKKDYGEKLIPSVIMVFWAFIILGILLALTGLALAFQTQMWFVYSITNGLGNLFAGAKITAGTSGYAFMLTLHRLLTYLLILLVGMHAYAVFVFGLVRSMISGKKDEQARA